MSCNLIKGADGNNGGNSRIRFGFDVSNYTPKKNARNQKQGKNKVATRSAVARCSQIIRLRKPGRRRRTYRKSVPCSLRRGSLSTSLRYRLSHKIIFWKILVSSHNGDYRHRIESVLCQVIEFR